MLDYCVLIFAARLFLRNSFWWSLEIVGEKRVNVRAFLRKIFYSGLLDLVSQIFCKSYHLCLSQVPVKL